MRASLAAGKIILSFPGRLESIPPCTTAYFIVGGSCTGKCLFCSQSRLSGKQPGHSRLSRVSWPEIELPVQEIIRRVNQISEFRRSCFQCTRKLSLQDLREMTEFCRIAIKPVSISASPDCDPEALLALPAVDHLNLSLDCATERHFSEMKGGSWDEFWQLLERLARTYPGKIRTHLIAGLGETDQEFLDTMLRLKNIGIGWGLFSFFPLAGTPLAQRGRIPRKRYRFLQMASYCLQNNLLNSGDFSLKDDFICGFKIENQAIREIAGSGKPFLTSGCSGCNRPFYNESAREEPYNFHRPLTEGEIARIISELFD
ncbi:MAG: radical SAM protein [Candidatus Wallbacteria bacterium]|nr:radical SAM protein [Candidatus Wallbacteria bacterium]